MSPDPGFSESSFGFRPGRSAHGAVRQVQRTIGEGYRFAVDLDLEKFFDRVNHDVLMARVARKVRDKCLLGLIGRYLRAGVLVGDIIQATELGTPQGGPLSPLLANILLDDLDKELERRGYRFARYADDLLILVKSPRTGERVKASVTRYLTRELKLAVTLSPGAKGSTEGCPKGPHQGGCGTASRRAEWSRPMTVSSWGLPFEERNCDGPTKPSPTSSITSGNSPDGAGVSRWPIGSTGSCVMSEAG